MDARTIQLGANLAAARKSAGLTQQALADRLGITQTTVARWETGYRTPDMVRLPDLATTMGYTVAALSKILFQEAK